MAGNAPPAASETLPRRCLLDVNVWVALLDEAHVFHAQALAFIETDGLRIATSPLIENGVIRILNLPAYSRFGPVGFESVANKLSEICSMLDHEFWPDDISLLRPDIANWPRILGHSQITDAYLLALAISKGGRLASFDHRIAPSAVHGATAADLLQL